VEWKREVSNTNKTGGSSDFAGSDKVKGWLA
jgi:hypothetical protein